MNYVYQSHSISSNTILYHYIKLFIYIYMYVYIYIYSVYIYIHIYLHIVLQADVKFNLVSKRVITPAKIRFVISLG